MEKPNKHGGSPKKKRGGKGAGDGGQKTSSPRSKLKDQKPQPVSAERRYKEMLHTTSHIYQPQGPSVVSDSLEGSRLSNQSTQTTPVPERKNFPNGRVLPEEIIADVPLTEIISKNQPTPSVIKPENFSDAANTGGKSKNLVTSQKNTEELTESSPQESSKMENDLLNHIDQKETACEKHLSAHTDSKPKSPISRPKLCESCTVSMLSYITMLRDMLDEVTNEIRNPEDYQSIQCAECVKERVIQRNQVRTSSHAEHVSRKDDVAHRPRDLPLSKQTDQLPNGDHTYLSKGDSETRGARQSDQQPTQMDPRTVLETSAQSNNVHTSQNVPPNLLDFAQPENRRPEQVDHSGLLVGTKTDIPADQSDGSKWTDVCSDGGIAEQRSVNGITRMDTSQLPQEYRGERESRIMDHSESPAYISDQSRAFFGDTSRDDGIAPASHHPDALDQRSWEKKTNGHRDHEGMPSAPTRDNYHYQSSPFFEHRDDSDGILSALSNEEREVYDSARGRAGWERLTDSQDYRDTSFGPDSTAEAFVTMATTNAEAISCLVLGSSLQLCRTTRTLCVLVTDGVSPSLRAPLASVFQVVQSVRSLDTMGTTKVALLDQPELGIFFRKLHVWRLVQFSKCVFLNPDTLVIQNSDELFCHEELSAVPDIGWPDCFNSGVFVFQPAVETFWKLVEFAESEGSYDGGDQGLLNAFFKTWSKDIHKKLSFIYNLMANVSYTYTPAFKQFGRNVKIVQFQGAFKPWHVKFYTETGQISPSTAVHPTYVQFVHVWLNIFRVRVLPLFSQDIQSFASSRNVISASELLKFYPSPIEIEADFLLTPPSVRIRPDSLKIQKQPSIIRRHSIGSSKELKSDYQPSEICQEEISHDKESNSVAIESKDNESLVSDESAPPLGNDVPQVTEELPSSLKETESSKTDAPTDDDGSRRSSIPGSLIGDYHGMAAWEQGRMDYMGSACSENILKRLHFLMDNSSDGEKPE